MSHIEKEDKRDHLSNYLFCRLVPVWTTGGLLAAVGRGSVDSSGQKLRGENDET